MARGEKKRRPKKQMVRHLTPAALREFWEALPEEERPLRLRGEEIDTLEELLAIHAREPREVDREMAAQNRAALRQHDKRGKEIDAEMRVKEREAREAQAGRTFMERLQGLGVRELDDDLAEDLDVSRQTVRKVGDELVEEGKLEVVPGERGRGRRPREYAYVEPAA